MMTRRGRQPQSHRACNSEARRCAQSPCLIDSRACRVGTRVQITAIRRRLCRDVRAAPLPSRTQRPEGATIQHALWALSQSFDTFPLPENIRLAGEGCVVDQLPKRGVRLQADGQGQVQGRVPGREAMSARPDGHTSTAPCNGVQGVGREHLDRSSSASLGRRVPGSSDFVQDLVHDVARAGSTGRGAYETPTPHQRKTKAHRLIRLTSCVRSASRLSAEPLSRTSL